MINPGIYAHIDPITNEIRYIGKSTNWPKRSHEHFRPSRLLKEDSHHSRWLRKLQSNNLRPIVTCIQEFSYITNDELNKAEIYWIHYFQSIGCKLNNITPGGEGYPIDIPTRNKISVKVKQYCQLKRPKRIIQYTTKLTQQERTLTSKHRKPIKDQKGNIYASIHEASRQLNIPANKITDVLHGRRRSIGGYIFHWVK